MRGPSLGGADMVSGRAHCPDAAGLRAVWTAPATSDAQAATAFPDGSTARRRSEARVGTETRDGPVQLPLAADRAAPAIPPSAIHAATTFPAPSTPTAGSRAAAGVSVGRSIGAPQPASRRLYATWTRSSEPPARCCTHATAASPTVLAAA